LKIWGFFPERIIENAGWLVWGLFCVIVPEQVING
jgi:hypothetical protein